ncbi:MAG: pyridoxal-phosphate dependent enzyme [Deltaproteobacteria bacterium]|nr:pyridoxal-phosphate dependent enzyme [Deltaproteobacteria bacterium]
MTETHPQMSDDAWIDRVRSTRKRIDPCFLDTPLVMERELDREVGAFLHLKNECLGPIRSFKGRGTEALLTRPGLAGPVVCASAGNFGQGIAWSAAKKGLGSVVFAATGASPMKVQRMKDLGAEVFQEGRDFDAAKEVAQGYARSRGLTFVEDGTEEELFLGTATLGQEIESSRFPFDTLLCPVGNGALFGGVAGWCARRRVPIRRIGVVAAKAPSMHLSFRAGSRVTTPHADTIADGIAVREPVSSGVAWVNAFADDIVEVSESAIKAAVSLVVKRTGIVVEPAGIAGVAALLEYPQRWRGERIVTPLCGGNLDPELLEEWSED